MAAEFPAQIKAANTPAWSRGDLQAPTTKWEAIDGWWLFFLWCPLAGQTHSCGRPQTHKYTGNTNWTSWWKNFLKGCKVRRGREKMGWRSRRSWGRSGHEYDQNRVYENFKELIKFLYIYIYLKGLSRINGLIRMMSDSRCWNLRVFVHNYFIHSLIHSTKTFLGVEEADTALDGFSTGWAWIRSYISSFRFHSP